MQKYFLAPIPFSFNAKRIDEKTAHELASGGHIHKFEGNKKTAYVWATNLTNRYIIGLSAYGKMSWYEAEKHNFDAELVFAMLENKI